MKDQSERTILKEGIVKITNRRATFGTKTYALSDITLVHMRVIEPNLFVPIFFAIILGICSALLAISNLKEYSQFLQIGLYSGIAAILFFLISRKTKYSVQIRNAVGERRVLETNNRNYAERVVRAMNEAMTKEDPFSPNGLDVAAFHGKT